jgi:hypothetical protein
MKFQIIQYEVKYSGEDQWKEISEKTCMEILVDSFDPLTPIIAAMLNGQEITTPDAIYRWFSASRYLTGFSHRL